MSSETAFGFFRTEIHCPKCGHTDFQPVKELVGQLQTQCRYCQADIDISGSDMQARILDDAEVSKKIMHPSRL